jgi:hypothetical protein
MKSLAVRFEAEQERRALRHLRVADLVLPPIGFSSSPE